MFEKAIRSKLRFNYNGKISSEDLWDLTVKQLDTIYVPLKAQSIQANVGSLLGDKPKVSDEIALQIEILEYIAKTKNEEADKREKAAEVKREKAKLLALLEQKQNSNLENLSEAEIQARIDAL